MSIADELQKLEDLRRSGSLSEAEFAQAKAKVLAGSAAPPDEQVGQHLSEQLAEVRYQNELARIDREWETERERYYITDRYGRRQLPSSAGGIGIALVGGIFGTIWTVFAFSITNSGPDMPGHNDGAFALAKVAFPLFGVFFVVGAIAMGIYSYNRAQEYEKALAAYQKRRRAVRPEQFQ